MNKNSIPAIEINKRHWSGKCKFSANINTFLKEELIEMTFNFEVKLMDTF